jgi:hypothetical protein
MNEEEELGLSAADLFCGGRHSADRLGYNPFFGEMISNRFNCVLLSP